MNRALTELQSTKAESARRAALHDRIERCVSTIGVALSLGSPLADDVWARECKPTVKSDGTAIVGNDAVTSRLRRLEQIRRSVHDRGRGSASTQKSAGRRQR